MSCRGATRVLLVALCAAVALAQTPPQPAGSLPNQSTAGAANPVVQKSALPEAPYVPLTNRQKFHIFVRQTYSPYTFVSAGINAGYGQATGDPYEYGGGLPGYGRRFGAALANTEASRFFNRFMFPALFHQDPRYFRAKPNTGFVRRACYAATRVLVTRSDSGKNVFNYSEMFGSLFTVSLENAYYPERSRTLGATMSRFAGALLSDASSNVTREFWPDIKRIFQRRAPKSVRKVQEQLERKVPGPVRDAVIPPDRDD